MPGYDDLSWKDLTQTEREEAKAHLIDSFGRVAASKLVNADPNVLAQVSEMREHLLSDRKLYDAEGKLAKLNPAVFGVKPAMAEQALTFEGVQDARRAVVETANKGR